MTRAETILSDLSTKLEGMVDESSLRKLVEQGQGPVHACEQQAGGADRASRVTALLLDDLSREIPESKMIAQAILTVRTSDEQPILIREMVEIDQAIRTVVGDNARKFLLLQFDDEAVEDRAALSLLYWLKDRT